jgi:hypothetical protein
MLPSICHMQAQPIPSQELMQRVVQTSSRWLTSSPAGSVPVSSRLLARFARLAAERSAAAQHKAAGIGRS